MSIEGISQPEEVNSPEEHLLADLKQELASGNLEVFAPVSAERKEQVEKEIADTATLLQGYNKPWFLAGGSSLECGQGEITRDHQDVDVAMYYNDLPGFYDYGRQKGYKFINTEAQEILSETDFLAQEDNAFLQKIDEQQPGPAGFEIMFLRQNDQGEILFSMDDQLTFPTAMYEQGTKYKDINNAEVSLTPPDVQLLYKLWDGREKDYQDIKKFYPKLTTEENQRLEESMQTLGLYFLTPDGQQVDTVADLLEYMAKEDGEGSRNFIEPGKVEEVATAELARVNQTITTIFQVAEASASGTEFAAAMQQKYGEHAGLKEQVATMKNFLYSSQKPTEAQFKSFTYQNFGVKDRLARKLKTEYLETKRWRRVKR